MNAYETEVHDIITYDTDRCIVRAKSDSEVTVFNTKTRETQDIPLLTYVVMVERPRKHYPKGREFRVYKVSHKMGGRSTILARGLTYLEAEAFRDAQAPIEGHYFMICNGKKKRDQF